MSGAGNHKATVVLDGRADGLSKAARESSNRVGVLESQVEVLREQLAKATARLDEQTASLERNRKRLQEQAEASRAASLRQRMLAEATKQAKAEDAEWASAIKKAKAEAASAEKAHAQSVAASQKAQAEAHQQAQQTIGRATETTISAINEQSSAWSRGRAALADYTIIARGAWDVAARGAAVVSELADRATTVGNVMNNLPFSIEPARRATGGLVKDMELATAATTLVSTGVVKNAEQFAELAHAAQALGARAGIDTARSFDSLAAALARGSTEMLDNLGIVLKQEQAQQEYAASLGVSVAALNETQKAEAFRVVAMRKIIEAAKGIKVDTDSAGAAVKRFENDLDRLANGALVGEAANISLREGLRGVVLEYKASAAEIRTYGSEADKLRRLLKDLNVGTDDLGISNAKLGTELNKVRREELSRIERLIFAGTATEENIQQLYMLRQALAGDGPQHGNDVVDRYIRQQREANAATSRARAELDEELRTLRLSIAYLEGKGEDQQLLNAALEQELDLRARILDEEGKSVEAADLRLELEMMRQRNAGMADKARRGGGRRQDVAWNLDAVFGDTERALQRIEQQERRAQAALERTGKGAAERFKQLNEQLEKGRQSMAGLQEVLDEIGRATTPDPFTLEAFGQVRARDTEIRMQQAQLELDAKLRGQQVAAARGELDPLQQLEQETQARLALIDVQEQAANGAMERAELANEREATLHQLTIARIDAEVAKRQEAQAAIGAMAKQQAELYMDFGSAAIRAALLEEGSIRKKLANIAKQNAVEFGLIQGPRESILALIDAASLNPVGAAQHLANAGQAFAFAASMGAIAGGMGAFSGGGRGKQVAGAFGASAFGGGDAGGGFGGAANSGGMGGSSSSRSPIPESREPGQRHTAGGPGTSSSTAELHIYGDFYGTPPPEFFDMLDLGLRDRGYRGRRAS